LGKLIKIIIVIALFTLLLIVISDYDSIYAKIKNKSLFTGEAVKNISDGAAGQRQPKAMEIPEEAGKESIVLFCPRDNCLGNLVYLINNSKKIGCAVFDLDIPELADLLKEKDARVFIDDSNYPEGGIEEKRNKENLDLRFTKQDNSGNLMHNKFCIFDNSIVMTGSFNPTSNDNEKNNNNMIVLFSKYLAENYEDELDELWKRTPENSKENSKNNQPARYPKIMLNGNLVENYFCPEDRCAEHIINILGQANESIKFMAFSFTHDGIGSKIAEMHGKGIMVKGVFEKKQNTNQYSEYFRLKNISTGINAERMDVLYDGNKYNMHHKVFIIDDKIVITGSFNPTANGDKGNDENILIIHNKGLAEEYIKEFDTIYGEAKKVEMLK